ncbi:MAG TPA: DegT/DnrJ/EryC1/StrS family aminotransferase [Longimicrobiales bacterium]|nr:DegT/DnrJ/EryC1/StrS family aminotransferase [Longimicrobiales bacterium]
MRVPLLDLQAQYRTIAEEVDAAVSDVVRSQRFVLGEPVERLEAELAERIGVAHAIGCASGTDALLLPLRALDLGPGDAVVVPSFTFFATAGAVWNAGLRPEFADVDPRTFNLTAGTLAAAVTPRTRAVVVVHLFGQMADMAPILELAEARGLHVIEDAAQSIDARQRIGGEWRTAGSLGVAGSLSFFPTKNLGAFGDGGMITTSDDALADRLRKLRVHGGRQMYHHEMVGTNSRLDAIQAAVLRAKLPHLDAWTGARRANAARYDEAFASVEGITAPLVAPETHHVYNQYTVRVEDRDAVRARLEEAGIGSGIYYPVPLHLQPCFSELGNAEGDFPVSERLAGEVLSLPVYPELTREQQERVIAAVARGC